MNGTAVWETVQARLRRSVPESEWLTVSAAMHDGEPFEETRYTLIDAKSLAIDLHIGSRAQHVTVTNTNGVVVYERGTK